MNKEYYEETEYYAPEAHKDVGIDLAITLLPLAVLCLFLIVALRKNKKHYDVYGAKYNQSLEQGKLMMERQQRALELMENTNKLLTEISQKLDKK